MFRVRRLGTKFSSPFLLLCFGKKLLLILGKSYQLQFVHSHIKINVVIVLWKICLWPDAVFPAQGFGGSLACIRTVEFWLVFKAWLYIYRLSCLHAKLMIDFLSLLQVVHLFKYLSRNGALWYLIYYSLYFSKSKSFNYITHAKT